MATEPNNHAPQDAPVSQTEPFGTTPSSDGASEAPTPRSDESKPKGIPSNPYGDPTAPMPEAVPTPCAASPHTEGQPQAPHTTQPNNPYGDPSAPQNPYYPTGIVPEKKPEGLSIASLVMGVLSLLMSCCCGGVIPGVLAIVFALVDRANRKFMNSYATGGLITGILGLVVGIVSIMFFLLFFLLGMGSANAEMVVL